MWRLSQRDYFPAGLPGAGETCPSSTPSPPRYGSWTSLPDLLANALERLGITGLYSHQVQAINFARRGQHVVVATGTASGKTLLQPAGDGVV